MQPSWARVVWLPGQTTRTCSSRHLPVWLDMAAVVTAAATAGTVIGAVVVVVVVVVVAIGVAVMDGWMVRWIERDGWVDAQRRWLFWSLGGWGTEVVA